MITTGLGELIVMTAGPLLIAMAGVAACGVRMLIVLAWRLLVPRRFRFWVTSRRAMLGFRREAARYLGTRPAPKPPQAV